MSTTAQPSRRPPVSPALAGIVLASGLVLLGVLLASFRLGFAADPETLLRANAARSLLAAGAGAALALAGALRHAVGRAEPFAELSLLGVSAGAAGGGFLLASQVQPGAIGVAAFALGAVAGAAVAFGVSRALDRPRRWANLGVAALLGALIGSAALAGSYARARSDVVAPAVAWLLGDLSGASLGSAGLVLALVAVLLVAAFRRLERPRSLETLALLAFGLGVGVAGLLAFVGSFVPLAVRALAPGSTPRALLITSAAAGAATVAAIDAVPRLLVGGYTLPFNVAAGMLAVPIFLGWNRARLRREAGPLHPALETLEVAAIVAATIVSAALAGFLSVVVRGAT